MRRETQQARLVEILRSLTITSSALIFFPRTRSPRDDDEISTFRTFPLNWKTSQFLNPCSPPLPAIYHTDIWPELNRRSSRGFSNEINRGGTITEKFLALPNWLGSSTNRVLNDPSQCKIHIDDSMLILLDGAHFTGANFWKWEKLVFLARTWLFCFSPLLMFLKENTHHWFHVALPDVAHCTLAQTFK